MTARTPSVLADRELVEMLGHEPQLLAIADALVAVRSPKLEAWVHPEARSRLRLPRRWVRFAPAAAVIAAVAALVVGSPWGDKVSVVDYALAAVGDEPVLHLAIIDPNAATGSLVDLGSGEAIRRDIRTEIWLDERRDLKRTVLMIDDQVVDEQLETSAGGLTRSGPVYTCDWIASHPAQAREAGVSCDRSRQKDSGAVSVDPALTEFADGYRSALAAGNARVSSEETIAGRDVFWLELEGGSAVDRVAVDASSYRPVLVESRDSRTRYEVETAETLPFRPSLFRKPQAERAQVGGGVISAEILTPAAAARALGGTLLSLPEKALGLMLVAVEQQERSVRFGDGGRETATVIKLTYRPLDDTGAAGRVELYESRTCLVSLGWTCGPRDPNQPSQVGYPVGRSGPALITRDGLYVSIWGSPTLHQRSLETARALAQASGGP